MTATTPELVAAVSNAGGLGLAPLWFTDAKGVKDFVGRVKALTDAPFGVNLNMDFPSMEQLDACLEENVPVISIFWGRSPEFIAHARSGGAKVIFSAWDAQSAAEAVDHGAHAICAQGWEAGGHVRGKVSTMALVPAVVDAVGDTPVIAAGGIADGRGLAAALALGASAAWIGTRFLSAKETCIHPDYVARLIDACETDTGYYDNLFDVGWPNAPHRALQNSTTKAWEAAGRPKPGQRPGEGDTVASSPSEGKVVRYQTFSPDTETTGDIEAVAMWCGQGVSMVRKVQSAGDIVLEIADEARKIISF
ncbi:NAD(P)H-dependent flavin oxidoreductase [Marimonas lutisalis]|uniref:NAD(P)H-dependent flavin oxidoreductase n=1 Tax=Marimonas lutisalis TaxID=2545756 RepID=UPI0010F6946C|nr:nitronate monooxygenase [Marimonas lutisalis]